MRRCRRVVVARLALVAAAATALAGLQVAPALAQSAGQNASVSLSSQVSTSGFRPTLGLGLVADRADAIPGDRIGYAATVTNTGALLSLSGSLTAASSADVSGTVVSWYDDVQYKDKASNSWVSIGGRAASNDGYSPVQTPGASTGLTLSATANPASGVTYPSGPDAILGTQIGAHDTASWSFSASVVVSAALEKVLADNAQSGGVRNVVHLELQPRDPVNGQPYIDRETVSDPFLTTPGAITDIRATLSLPNGKTVGFDSSTDAGLGSLAVGKSVSLGAGYVVPPVSAPAADETDGAYLKRLASADRTSLIAGLTAAGTAPDGSRVTGMANSVGGVAEPQANALTTEHLPVVTIAKSGPANADAGTTANYDLPLADTGSAPASGLAVSDTVPDGSHGTVTGVPATLAPSGTATPKATYAIPVSQASGPLTDTATVAWTDANGNRYGPVSATFTTQVASTYAGSTLALEPMTAGPNVTGTRQRLTATLLDRNGQPLPDVQLRFAVLGANPVTGTATTDAAGQATFSYVGTGDGTDTAQAMLASGASAPVSNTATIGWITPIQPVSSTTVDGRFFAEPAGSTTFRAKPGDTTAFGESFPSLAFNPPSGALPHNITGVSPATRPFTDVTTDVAGNALGALPAQGNGYQAGSGDMACFDAVFTADLTVAQASDVTFRFQYGSGLIFGVGGGATRVNGMFENVPAGATTAFEGYAVVGADNTFSSSVRTNTVTVHFPAAGSYPYEVDYAGCGSQLSLVMQTVSFSADTSPLSLYIGYADGLRPAGSVFPYPWRGSPNVTFIGNDEASDSGALRFDNTSDAPIHLDSVTVDIGSWHGDIWKPYSLDVPAHGSLILEQTIGENFDTSDFPYITCSPDGLIPKIHVTVDGATTDYTDTDQILNTKGYDQACYGNESHAWVRIGGTTTGVDHPLPPAASVQLTPLKTIQTTVGKQVTAGISVMDGSGQPTPNTAVFVTVSGPNAQTTVQPVLTDASGFATFSYVGWEDGTDQLQATTFVTGMRALSNTVDVVWTVPPYTPPPSPSPSDTGTPSPTTTSPTPVPTTTSPTPTPTSSSPTPSPTATSPTPSPTTTSPTPSPTATSPTPSPTTTSPAPSPTPTAPAGAPPAIVSPGPADGSRVTAPTPVTASIQPPTGASITSWKVTVANTDGGTPATIGNGTGAPPATLATFDPTTVADGTYRITVSATASTGGVQTVSTSVVVDGKLKPGRVAATWHDIDATVGTGTVGLLRSYDSTVTRSGDFGYGWSLAVDGYRVTTNRALGGGGWVQYDASCTLGLCTTGYRTTVPHFVSVTFPDGHVESFDFTPTGETFDYWLAHAAFTARPGTTSTLQALGDTDLIDEGDGNLYDENTFDPYAPTQYQLTTRTGQVLVLDVDTGLVSMTDASGVTYGFSTSGITSSAGGGGARYTRDAQGRITQIDALGTTKYSYDTAGNLASVTDLTGGVTTYAYDNDHDLLSVTGPGGTPLRTMHYDSAGRVTSITDANGNTTQISTDLGARTQTVTDGTGKLTTVSMLDDLGDVVRKVEAGDGTSRTWAYTYDSLGHQLTETDPIGRTTTSTYDAAGDRLSATDAAGHITRWSYGAHGEVLTETDPAGHVTSYAYDTHLNVTSVTDPAGNVTKYAYNAAGLRTSMTDARGGVTSYTYTAAGQPATTTDPMARVTTYTYDARGNVLTTVDPSGRTTSYTYDGDGRQLTVTDPLGHTTTNAYDAFGNRVSTTDAAGGTTRYEFAGDHLLTKQTDPDGRVTTYTYDADGRVLAMTMPGQHATVNAYDAFGDLASVVDPAGRKTDYGYDKAGRKTAATQPNGKTWQYGYDAVDHQTSVADPLGHETDYTYDASGHTTAVTDPLGAATRYTYTLAGNVATVVEADGNTTTYGYDALGDTTSLTDPAGHTTTYGFDPDGELASVTDPTGRVTSYSYTALGLPATSTDPAGHVTTYGYDAVGNRTSITQPSGVTTTYGYDAVNRLTSETDGLGHAATRAYDAAGLLTATVDRRGNRTTYGYDPAGRLTTLTDPLGGVVKLGYDADGEETSVTDPDGVAVTYRYDALGDRAAQTDGLGNTKTWAYDAAGRLASATNARGQTTTYTYDAADRLTGSSSPDGNVTQVWDAAGNRTSRTDATGTTTFGYDADARITKVAAPAGTVTYGYDAAGRRTSVDVGGRRVTYAYDAVGLLASATDGAGTSTFAYSADGQPTSVHRPNGIVTSYGYDGADRLVSVHHDTAAGATVAHFDYTLDANGDRIAVAGPDGTDAYTVDADGRLTAESGPSGTASYTYTAAGNRSSVTRDGITTSYAYDQVGRLLSAGDTTYGFDADGDLTTAGGDTFSYDSAGHLTAASVGGKPSTYQYDGDGLRVSATANGTTTPYVLDQAAALPVVLGAGDHAYTRTPDGQLLGDTSSGATLTPLADALGSIRAVTDSTGTVVGTAAYDGYGNAAVGTGQQTAFGYTGALADAGGLVDLNAREYDPATGRFLQSDSNETGGPGTIGYNRYAYALDDPTTATDPTGHQGDFTLGGVMEGIDLQDVLTKTLVATVATTGTIGLLLVGAHALEDVRDRPSERPDYLYKTGSLGAMSWTPRPGADTDGWPQNGLSFYTSAERAIEKAMENPNAKKVPNVWRVPADEVEAIPGLMIVVDAGDETHWFVTGVLPTILEEWANTRATAAERPSTWTAALISMAEAA